MSITDVGNSEKGAHQDGLKSSSRSQQGEATIRVARSLPASGVCLHLRLSRVLRMANPSQSALAIGAFATTLTTLSLSLMEWRGVTTANAFIANFFFVAGLGMLITAQWEMSVGNGFAYTVFSAFGMERPQLLQVSDDS